MAYKEESFYKYYIVYKTTCIVNNKIYIGQHRTNYLDDSYLGSGKLLNEDIKKYGSQNFTKEILFIFDNFNDMNKKEMEIITPEFVAREDTYNMIVGGQIDNRNARKLGAIIANKKKKENGTFHKNIFENKTKEEIQEIVNKRRETIRRRVAAGEIHCTTSFLGKHHSEESKKKISLANKEKFCGKNNPMSCRNWYKDPNDKTKELAIKEGDPIPDGWVKGHWHNEHLKVIHTQYCPYCGAEKGKCKHPEICSRPQMIIGYKKIFHPTENIYGTNQFYNIWFKDLALVKQWYLDEKLSMANIAQKISYKKKSLSSLYSCVGRMLKLQNISLRSFSEASKICHSKRFQV